ncbi:MAG TPA: hypothetical protein VHW00_06975 [Thermoanaerobaculia bacterium]|nr:hypothetical protein [Thermoanaerobaculia bacterium]
MTTRIYDRGRDADTRPEAPAGWDSEAWKAWMEESDQRIARMGSGEDRELTLDEFWSDEEDDV